MKFAGFCTRFRQLLSLLHESESVEEMDPQPSTFHKTPGTCFSKVPKLFGRISGDIILFVSSKRRRLEARNFAIIFTFTPFTTYEKNQLYRISRSEF